MGLPCAKIMKTDESLQARPSHHHFAEEPHRSITNISLKIASIEGEMSLFGRKQCKAGWHFRNSCFRVRITARCLQAVLQ
jgi:hypothetical protein